MHWQKMSLYGVVIGVMGCNGPFLVQNASLALVEEQSPLNWTGESYIPDQKYRSAGPAEAWKQAASSLEFVVCYEDPSWERPSEASQIKQIESIPRFAGALENGALGNLFTQFWSNQIYVFTTYGLSARVEPVYFSGLWTIQDQIWSCYDGERSEQINTGALADVWLLNHRLVELQWQTDHYLATVESTEGGFQLVQFPRLDNQPLLPLQVTTVAGEAVSVLAADWLP